MSMTIDHVGLEVGPFASSYRWQDAVLYALGVGAKRGALDFLYEGRGPRVLPTYGLIPDSAVFAALHDRLGGRVDGIVHASQSLRMCRPFPPSGELVTRGKVAGIYDLKRMAEAVFEARTSDGEGNALCESRWSILYRFDGGFGGPPPPRRTRFAVPERAPDFMVEEATLEEQALLYRLCGDLNPLHADPKVAQQAGFTSPILHGLCTYGMVGRAFLRHACDNLPERFSEMHGQFLRPVYPGDALKICGWRETETRWLLQAVRCDEPQQPVFGNAYAETVSRQGPKQG